MSYQKPYRRANTPQKSTKDDFRIDPKYKNGVLKLQELFPNWTAFDLQSSLIEVNGDVETAIIRISEGHAEQWGSVSRRKDKKQSTAMSPSPSGTATGAPTHRERESSRGGRGGLRGGRGGGRGGRGGSLAGRPASRNQHTPTATSGQTTGNDWVIEPASTDGGATADSWGVDAAGTGWGEDSTPAPEAKVEKDESLAPPPSAPNGISKATTPSPAPAKATPVAGAIRSWAQVARPQEKPKPVPPQPPVKHEEPVQGPELEASEPELQPDAENVEAVWEEPTTAQAPVWDDEPAKVTAHKAEGRDNVWNKDSQPSPALQEQTIPPDVPSPSVDQSTPTLTSDASSTVPSSAASPTPPPSGKSSTTKVSGSASRVASRFKPDQAVVMPSFGTVGSGIGIGGMKFGSLSISDDVDGPSETKEPEPIPVQPPAPAPAPAAVVPLTTIPAAPSPAIPAASTTTSEHPVQHPPTSTPSHQAAQSFLPPSQSSETLTQALSNPSSTTFTPQATTLASLASSATSGIFQPHQPASSALQSSIHQAGSAQQSSTPFSSSFSPLGQVNAPQPTSSQPLSHGLAQYSQHGLPTHVDTPPLQQNPAQSQHGSQAQSLGSYYRQHEYGFSPSNQSLLSQHASQQQAAPQGQQEQAGYSAFSNLAQSFNQGQDFGTFNERGFYEGGYQPSGFGSRNFLGPDDHGKPSSSHQSQQPSQQQPHSLSSTGGQAGTGGSSQGQSTGGGPGQSGQQGYPPPLPYYYPNPYYGQPNPYYSGPNPGYGVGMGQPFMNVKYPPVYPPGPGPATPTSGGSKGVNQSGPPPGPNSYSHSGLYGGPHHHPGSYDDMSYGPPHQQHHQQHQGNQPSSSADYGKPPLYGLNHGQGFLGQPSSRHAHPQSNPSPENALRGYSGQPGSNVTTKPGETPTRAQPIYGGAGSGAGVSRFNGPLGGAGGPQQGQGQGSYPQSGDSNYYQYQRPQYWH